MLRILIISTALGKKVYQIDYGTPICIMEQQNSLLYNSCILSFLENVIYFHLYHTMAHTYVATIYIWL